MADQLWISAEMNRGSIVLVNDIFIALMVCGLYLRFVAYKISEIAIL